MAYFASLVPTNRRCETGSWRGGPNPIDMHQMADSNTTSGGVGRQVWFSLALTIMVAGVAAVLAVGGERRLVEEPETSPLSVRCLSPDGSFNKLLESGGRPSTCPAATHILVFLDRRVPVADEALEAQPLFPHVMVFFHGEIGTAVWPQTGARIVPIAPETPGRFRLPYIHRLTQRGVTVVALLSPHQLTVGALRTAARAALTGIVAKGVHARRWVIETTGLPGDAMIGVAPEPMLPQP